LDQLLNTTTSLEPQKVSCPVLEFQLKKIEKPEKNIIPVACL
jgi:hypothetical protein